MSKEKEALIEAVGKMAAVIEAARKLKPEEEIEEEATEETETE